MAKTSSDDDENTQTTAVGCVLMLLSLGVIGVVGVVLVRYRDPDGEPLPKKLAIILPIVAGALFYAAGAGILKFLGISVELPRKSESGDEGPQNPPDRYDQG
jgi:hypothetical protein